MHPPWFTPCMLVAPWGSFILDHLSVSGGRAARASSLLVGSFWDSAASLTGCAHSPTSWSSLLFLPLSWGAARERSATYTCSVLSGSELVHRLCNFYSRSENLFLFAFVPLISSCHFYSLCLPGVSCWLRCKQKGLQRNFSSSLHPPSVAAS